MTTEEYAVADPRQSFLVRAVEWLRAGYPAGVPRQDYVVLLGLLRRKLTEAEVRQVAEQLSAHLRGSDDVITRDEIEQMINTSVLQEASDEDVARVSARLAAGGWPLADPPMT